MIGDYYYYVVIILIILIVTALNPHVSDTDLAVCQRRRPIYSEESVEDLAPFQLAAEMRYEIAAVNVLLLMQSHK